jgi:cytosine/adenosine deaminase-related metal-dependent hydrolase
MAITHGLRPGFVNAHTHLYSALAPYGLPAPAVPPVNFVQILERIWWKLDRALDEAALRASARLYAAESLLAGTTTLVDHHESPHFIEGSLDVLGDACQEFGVRAVVCYGATDRNGGRDEGHRGLEECRRFLRANRRPLVRGAVGLHASFTCSEETLREAGTLARELGAVVHVHVAEDGADVADARRRGFAGPLERLLAADALPAGSILAHGVHLTPAQVRAAAERGLWLVQNPRSNEGNRVGYGVALQASAKVALGTDGWAADMPVEQAALERLAGQAPGEDLAAAGRRLDAGRDLAAAFFGGAAGEAAGERDSVVLAAVGGGANGGGTRAERAVVAGRTVVEGGRLLTGDIEELRARAREAAPALWRRMAAL